MYSAKNDFDGDGKPDRLYVDKDGKIVNITCTAGYYSLPNTVAAPNGIRLIDFNGNGKTDIMIINGLFCTIYEASGSGFVQLYQHYINKADTKVIVGDFNGDGKTDIVSYYYGNIWKLYYSTGKSFYYSGIDISTFYNPDTNVKYAAMDINGDGKDEIVEAYAKMNVPDTAPIYFDNTISFYTFSDSQCSLSKLNFTNNYAINYGITSGDFNGDGAMDFIYLDKTYCMPMDNNRKSVTQITDGMSNITQIAYSPLTATATGNNPAIYTKTSTTAFPVKTITAPVYVVNNVKVSTDKTNEFVTTNYRYKDLRIHAQGRGWLGFASVESKNTFTNITSTSTFGYDNTYYYPYKIQDITTISLLNNTVPILSKTNYTYDKIVLNSQLKRHFPYISAKTDLVYSLDNNEGVKTTNTIYSYNQTTCYLENTTTTAGDWKTVTKYIYNGLVYNTGAILASKLSSTSTQKFYKNVADRELITAFKYYANGMLYSQAADGVSKIFEYYPTGNIRYTKVTAKDLPTKTEYFDYDYQTQRFVKEKRINEMFATNPDANKIFIDTYEYEPFFGRITKHTDAEGVVTNYSYNGQTSKIWYITSNTDNTTKTTETTTRWTQTGEQGVYCTIAQTTAEPTKYVYYDRLGREILRKTKNMDGVDVMTETIYDMTARTTKQSFPYMATDAAKSYITTQYDELGREISKLGTGIDQSTVYGLFTTKVTDNLTGQYSTKTTDQAGVLTQATDNVGTITYSYYPSGKLKSTTVLDKITDTFSDEYDDKNFKTTSTHTNADAGKITSVYNAYGQLESQTNARQQKTTYQYDEFGRITTATEPERTISYFYKKTLLDYVETGNYKKEYKYYPVTKQIKDEIETINTNNQFTTSYVYDTYGRLFTTKYPNNVIVENGYNTLGFQITQKVGNTIVWKLDKENTLGQPTSYKLNDGTLTRSFGYDPTFKQLTSDKITVDATQTLVQSASYTYYQSGISTGLMSSRSITPNTTENFEYDTQLRLNKAANLPIQYEPNGNLLKKEALNLYYDNTAKPHAITRIDGSLPYQEIKYTSFDKVKSITQGTNVATFTYTPDHERCIMTMSGTTPYTRYYVGNYEKTVTGNNIKEIIYLNNAVVITTNGVQKIYYLSTDHLGSIIALIDGSTNQIVESYKYDAWGKRTCPTTTPILYRGYTGHEHLTEFELINMNGRMYDPVLGRFLSPDNYVQMPSNTQNYNRYSYCLNNPLKYTDPSGQLFGIDDILIGAAIFGVGNLLAHAIKGDVNSFGDGLKYLAQGALAGAAVGAAFAYAPMIPYVGSYLGTGLNVIKDVYMVSTSLSVASGIGQGAFTGNWNALGNAGKLALGNFYLDENLGFFSGTLQGLSRFTWELPQTMVGYGFSQGINTLGWTRGVSYYGGATVSQMYGNPFSAVTIGSFITGERSIEANPDNWLFQHEYGHYLQSQSSGIFYLSRYGIPSLLSIQDHNTHPVEQDANIRALIYFNSHIQGYSGWRFGRNQIIGYDPGLSYNSLANQRALKNGHLGLSAIDVIFAPLNLTYFGIVIPGLINSMILDPWF